MANPITQPLHPNHSDSPVQNPTQLSGPARKETEEEMSLEAIPKYFFPKSTMISDSPRATASDSMTGTDWMAALGLADLKSGFGLDLFLAKMGVSSPDKALQCLTDYALTQTSRYRTISKLSEDTKQKVVQILATFAYQDYSRSAASTRQCECCKGEGFIEAEVFTTKAHTPFAAQDLMRTSIKWGVKSVIPAQYEVRRQVRETARVLCHSCNGKGVVSNACRCHGKGKVLDKAETEIQGFPVMKDCPKCQGRGYARLPAENVRRAICAEVMELSEPSWRRNYKPLYEALITQCHKEERITEVKLNSVTKRE